MYKYRENIRPPLNYSLTRWLASYPLAKATGTCKVPAPGLAVISSSLHTDNKFLPSLHQAANSCNPAKRVHTNILGTHTGVTPTASAIGVHLSRKNAPQPASPHLRPCPVRIFPVSLTSHAKLKQLQASHFSRCTSNLNKSTNVPPSRKLVWSSQPCVYHSLTLLPSTPNPEANQTKRAPRLKKTILSPGKRAPCLAKTKTSPRPSSAP